MLILLVLWSVVYSSQNHDSPIVIERPLNRINLDITITYVNHMKDILRTVMIIDQSWTDGRLQFRGNSAVPVSFFFIFLHQAFIQRYILCKVASNFIEKLFL
uniref:Neur_chan_LBD domain-containing protein n=1 Tax=Heterorhabditis bacteriophora TaxID=37862 RepID=A0A1I7XHL7_HETBA